MRLTTLLPLLLTCSNALLVPALAGSEESPVPYCEALENTLRVESYKRDDGNASTPDQGPQQYIVVYEDGHDDEDYETHAEWVTDQVSSLKKRGELEDLPEGIDGDVSFYNILSFKGYAAYLPPTLLEEVKADPLVAFVEEDSIATVAAFQAQSPAPWGLARLSLRAASKPPSSRYAYNNDGGRGVTVYVLDTGIKVSHPDFGGRATWGPSYPLPPVQADDSGHGSHVAGIIGGTTFGVSKNVNMVSVKVANSKGQAPVSDIIKGLQFSVNNHQAKVSAKQRGYKGAVINISINSGISSALDTATNAAVKAGVHVVVSAGNDNKDTCTSSPARASGPITVGATDINDRKGCFSNWGKCVDINAPGVDITSVGINSYSATFSGTSMAAPHVAGLVSYFMSLQPGLGSEFSASKLVTPAAMKKKLIGYGARNVIAGLVVGTPNVLAYNGGGGDLTGFWAL